MKVAVCMSGHMRTYKQTFASWDKHVFEKYTPDVYIHSWNHVNWTSTDPVDETDVQSTFNPKKLVIEDYTVAKREWERIAVAIYAYKMGVPGWEYLNTFNEISAFRKVYLSHALIDTSYDLVIQGRPDLLICDDIVDIALRALEKDDTTFLVRASHPSDTPRDGHHPPSIVPELCIGRQPTIKYLSEIFPNLDMLLQEARQTKQPKLVLNTNLVLYEWMKRGGFDYTYLPSFDTFTILR